MQVAILGFSKEKDQGIVGEGLSLDSPFGRRVERVYDLDDDRDLQTLGLSKNQERADRIIHFEECHHAVIEKKGSSQPVKKGISQLESTILNVKLPNIKFAILVKDRIPRIEQGFYHWDQSTGEVTVGHSVERPVMVAHDKPLIMLTHARARAYGLV